MKREKAKSPGGRAMRHPAPRVEDAETRSGEVRIQKFYAPQQALHVERRSIIQRVFGERAPEIVILQAPAGHGKTLALGQIKRACEARGVTCAWLALDESDNDSRRHANHLSALLAQMGHRPGKARAGRPTARTSRLPSQRADWLIDALARFDRQVALFVDEFEVISDRSVLTFWRDFLLRSPPSVRVFLGTRNIPELGLARLLVGNRLQLLSADDLRFSRDEVQAFFELHHELSLQPAEIEAVFRRSEGWPAALQLFRLGLLNSGNRDALRDLDHSRPRELAEYLTECVLDRQPPDVRDFLLRTSVLVRLHADLCHHVTGRQDSQVLLLRLEREGLFVRALDNERAWFRYHPLFSALLREQLAETDAAAIPELHERAAAWSRDHGHPEDAMHHAVAAGDFANACAILRNWSSRLVASGEMETVDRWLDEMPQDKVDADWPLTIRLVWALTFLNRPAKLARHLRALDQLRATRGDLAKADESTTIRAIARMCADRIEEAQALIDTLPTRDGLAEGFEAFEQAASENMRSYLAIFRGEFVTAHTHLARARSFSQLGDASFTRGYAACFEGALLVLEGRITAALDCLRSGLDQQRSVLDSSFASASMASCYLWALYEANDLELLEAVAEEYRDMLVDTAVPDFFAVGQICVARTHQLRGRPDAALVVFEQALYVSSRNGWPRISAMLELEKRAVPMRDEGRALHGAAPTRIDPRHQALLEQAAPPAGWSSPANELHGSTSFISNRRGGDESRVAQSTPNAVSAMAYRQLRAGVMKAVGEWTAGKQVQALRAARQSVLLAARTGLVRPLLDHGPDFKAILPQLLDSDPTFASSSAGRLAASLVASGNVPDGGVDAAPTILRYSSFTTREREILGLLSRRLSNKEIAKRSLLSGNTVKFHLKNVFAKLGVGSRLEAYAAIVRLNLSDS